MREIHCSKCHQRINTLINEEFFVINVLNFNNKHRKNHLIDKDVYYCKECYQESEVYKLLDEKKDNELPKNN